MYLEVAEREVRVLVAGRLQLRAQRQRAQRPHPHRLVVGACRTPILLCYYYAKLILLCLYRLLSPMNVVTDD
jgi:hypothetical protein